MLKILKACIYLRLNGEIKLIKLEETKKGNTVFLMKESKIFDGM